MKDIREFTFRVDDRILHIEEELEEKEEQFREETFKQVKKKYNNSNRMWQELYEKRLKETFNTDWADDVIKMLKDE